MGDAERYEVLRDIEKHVAWLAHGENFTHAGWYLKLRKLNDRQLKSLDRAQSVSDVEFVFEGGRI